MIFAPSGKNVVVIRPEGDDVLARTISRNNAQSREKFIWAKGPCDRCRGCAETKAVDILMTRKQEYLM